MSYRQWENSVDLRHVTEYAIDAFEKHNVIGLVKSIDELIQVPSYEE